MKMSNKVYDVLKWLTVVVERDEAIKERDSYKEKIDVIKKLVG